VKYRSDILEAIKEGRISVTEAIQRELATVRVTWEEAKTALTSHISVDPSFPGFVRWCRRNKYPLTVVSSGMEPVLDLFIGDLDVPRFAHSVNVSPKGWRYSRQKENDKDVILSAAKKNGTLVYVGDGTSDVSAIPFADILFAKSYLAEYCTRCEVDFIPFGSFDDVKRELTNLLT
jgi:2-hydroxy-3-keto-5-methylthiopentenyl-1-phosphate phosphatase